MISLNILTGQQTAWCSWHPHWTVLAMVSFHLTFPRTNFLLRIFTLNNSILAFTVLQETVKGNDTFTSLTGPYWMHDPPRLEAYLMGSHIFRKWSHSFMDLGLLNVKTDIYYLLSLKFNFLLLLLYMYISHKNSEEKFLKYQYKLNSLYVIMSWILLTPVLHNALIKQGEIWCWSHLGLDLHRHLML